MGLSTLDGDVTHRNGTFTFAGNVKLPSATVGDKQADPTTPLDTNKVRHRKDATYAQPNGSAVVSEQKAVHVAYGASGNVVAARCGIRTPGSGGGMSVTVDVKKNGTSILTAVMTITAGTLAFALVAGSIATAGYVAGDVFEVVITATPGGGTLPQGLFVDLIFDEDPA